jgi:hypoxanthine phosphoribosyltransferase
VTLDAGRLQEATSLLSAHVSGAGYRPTHLIAIAAAGLHIADRMAPAFTPPPVIVEITVCRSTTRLKRWLGVGAILARCPRALTTALRHLEHRFVTRRRIGGRRIVSMEARDLRALQPRDGSAVRALFVDDVLDTGASLEACLDFVKPHLDSRAELKAAVLAISLPDPKVKPDFYLYTNATLRGPWSLDA